MKTETLKKLSGGKSELSIQILLRIWEGEFIDNEEFKKFYYRDDRGLRVEIKDCVIKGRIELKHLSFENELFIKDCVFEDSFRILYSKCEGRISFYNSIFKGHCHLLDNTLESFCIYDTLTENFKFESNQVGLVVISGSKFDQAYITSNRSANDFFIDGSQANTLNIFLNTFNTLYLRGSKTETSIFQELALKDNNINTVYLREYWIHVLNFSESFIRKDNSILITGCTIASLNLSHFVNFGYLSFNSVKPFSDTSKIHIKFSDLGKAQFINCELRSYSEFVIESSKIVEVFIEGDSKSFLPTFASSKDSDTLLHNRLGYSQIKRIYENRGDYVAALTFQAKELEAFRKSLFYRGVLKPKRPYRKWLFNASNWFNLSLNKWTNNYGTSWVRAFALLISISSFLYFSFCFSLGYRPANPFSNENWSRLGDILSYYPEYLNPIRKSHPLFDLVQDMNSKGLKGDGLNNLSVWIDYFSRIVSAYLVYQFIQAFRKYGRKIG